MAVNGVITNTVINWSNPYTDIVLIKQAIERLRLFSSNVENCGYPETCQTCQACQTCQTAGCQSYTCQSCQSSKPNCNCDCGSCKDNN